MQVLCWLNQELAEDGLQKTYPETKINSFLSKTRPAELIWERAFCCCTEKSRLNYPINFKPSRKPSLVCTGPAYETPSQFPGTAWAKHFPHSSTFEWFLLHLTFCLDYQIGLHLGLASKRMETFCWLFCVCELFTIYLHPTSHHSE